MTGNPFNFVIEDIDPSVQFGAVLMSFIQDIPGTDLGSLGMPGCNAHIDPFANISAGLFIPSGATQVTHPFSASIPSGFEGVVFYCQAALLQPGANPLQVVVSNGLTVRRSTGLEKRTSALANGDTFWLFGLALPSTSGSGSGEKRTKFCGSSPYGSPVFGCTRRTVNSASNTALGAFAGSHCRSSSRSLG